MTIVYNTCHIARPGRADVWRGVRSAFNLSGSTRCEYYFAGSSEDADREAVFNDWFAVFEDLDRATESVTR